MHLRRLSDLDLPHLDAEETQTGVVVCKAPLVAPVPLPYHSPRFLQFQLLPDTDQDLSHPPYIYRQTSRKRKVEESDDSSSSGHSQPADSPPSNKRRLTPGAHQHQLRRFSSHHQFRQIHRNTASTQDNELVLGVPLTHMSAR
ncbi:hypothetical protein CC2G_005820 [Coprinopsis cinerea AmutBmut pab1-1]|nr:hypothetical protein CC2G_005820 [Coprinopsis cinerea AmutBmut pab1-1]